MYSPSIGKSFTGIALNTKEPIWWGLKILGLTIAVGILHSHG
jgi:hypothetical protein